MRAPSKTPWPSASALWSLLWRAFLLAPLAAVFGLIWALAWPLLVVLPFCEVCLLIQESWLLALITPAVWILLFLFTRTRWFKADRHDFPNDQENI